MGKPTLMQLRRSLNLDTKQVADEASLLLRNVYLMEIGVATPRDTAVRVMAAISRLSGRTYTINDIEYTEKGMVDGRSNHGSSDKVHTLPDGKNHSGTAWVLRPGVLRRSY